MLIPLGKCGQIIRKSSFSEHHLSSTTWQAKDRPCWGPCKEFSLQNWQANTSKMPNTWLTWVTKKNNPHNPGPSAIRVILVEQCLVSVDISIKSCISICSQCEIETFFIEFWMFHIQSQTIIAFYCSCENWSLSTQCLDDLSRSLPGL